MTTVKKHRIYINARFLTQSMTGVQRYATEVVRALDNLLSSGEIDPSRYEFVMLAPKNAQYDPGFQNIPLKIVGRFTGHLWEQFELPLHARSGYLISLCNTAPMFKLRQSVTIHDAAVFSMPGQYTFAFRTWYKVLYNVLGKVADKIMTVSQFSRGDLLRHVAVAERKVPVILEGKEHALAMEPDLSLLEKHGVKSKSYVLAVSSMSPNKNFHAIVEAIERMGDVDFDIVIAGGTNPKIFSKTETPLPERVKHVGYVTDAQLRALYENASCFVFPSFYEGFGLPPLEAMALGCPVIMSRSASLPEVGGDAVVYIDPNSPQDLADKIQLVMNDTALQESLGQKGLERAGLFTWEKCAREMFQLLEGEVTA